MTEEEPFDKEAWDDVIAKLKQLEEKHNLDPNRSITRHDYSNCWPPDDFDYTPYLQEADEFRAEIALRAERRKKWPEIEERRRKKLAQIYPSHSEDDKPRKHSMSTDRETLMTLAAAGNLPATTDYLMSLPQPVRSDAIEVVQSVLHKPQSIKLKYHWPLYARPSQLPPKDDWNTWLILAGRGFGKTRTGAEWVRAQVENGHARRIALVARSLTEAQSIMIEGESGILNISPPSNRPIYEPSKRKLTWPNGAHALVFSSHEPDQLRGPSVRRRMVRRARIMGVPKPDLGQPQLRPPPRTPATLRSHHDSQVHRACQNPHQRPRRTRHKRHHIRQQR